MSQLEKQMTTITVTSSHPWHHRNLKLEISEGRFTWTRNQRIFNYNRDLPEDSCNEFVDLFRLLGFIEYLYVEGCTLDELYEMVYKIPFNKNLVFVALWKCSCGHVTEFGLKTPENYENLFASLGNSGETPLLQNTLYHEHPCFVLLHTSHIVEKIDIYDYGCKRGITRTFDPFEDSTKTYIHISLC